MFVESSYSRRFLCRIDTKEDGDYKICFDNTFSRFSNKLTFFEIITDDPDPNWEKLNQLEDIDEVVQDTEYEFKLDSFKVRNKVGKNLNE